jgi:hypothetical protein
MRYYLLDSPADLIDGVVELDMTATEVLARLPFDGSYHAVSDVSSVCDPVSGHVPIHVTETGWPTGHNRDEAKQARILQSVAEAVHDTGEVSVYEFFSLRDGISDGNRQNGFGLLHDDYTPKPAFEAIRRIIKAP